ncbi:MAG: hypothetical protein WCI73_01025 [Phycisphaerae bacterium]
MKYLNGFISARSMSWLLGMALCIWCLLGQAAGAQAADPGWAVHYYGGVSFWYHAGVVRVPGPSVTLNMDQVKWPPQNWDAAKGPLFIRDGGWSLAAYATLNVTKAGEYRFAPSNGAVLLKVNDRQIDPATQPTITLPVGAARLALFIKPESRPAKSADNQVHIDLLWQAPGTNELTPVPAGTLSHDADDLKRDEVYRPEFPCQYEHAEQHWYPQRRFTVDIPESGLYETASHFAGVPRYFKVLLDEQPLLYVQGDRQGVQLPMYQATDRAGTKDCQRLDFLFRSRAVRYLEKGRHTLDVFAHYGPWVWDDEMQEAMKSFRLGLSRVGAGDPLNSLAIYAKGRSDMVLQRGEDLVVAVERATEAAATYRMVVKPQRGADKVVWEHKLTLRAGRAHAKAEFKYPAAVEGAFEYTVRDADDHAVDGPWAFVVVDPTPLPLPTAKSGVPSGELRKVLVDSVDCTQEKETAHLFRDNGTSQVVQGPAGSYRVTGTSKMRPVDYVQDDKKAWRRTGPGEKGQGQYYAVDWFAYTLKVKNPGKPYLVVAQVPNDVRRLVSVYANDPVTTAYNGWVLDAGEAPAAGPFSPLSFVVWPNGNSVDICVWCSNDNHNSPLNRQGAVAKIELYELPDGLTPLPEAAGGWKSKAEFGWDGEQVNLGVAERTMPSLWAGNEPLPSGAMHSDAYHDWQALQTAWERFGQLALYRGDNLCIMPVQTYGMNLLQGEAERMLPRLSDCYSTGFGAKVEDPIERDIFKLMLLTAQKYHVRLAADFMIHRLESIEPFLAKQAGVAPEGILLTDGTGKMWRSPNGSPMLNPAHPVARRYLVNLMDALGKQYGSYPAFAGVRTRQWSGWPSGLDAWFYDKNLGYDDATVSLFCQETGVKLPDVPTDGRRFTARREYLLGGAPRETWLNWRCQKVLTLREEMLKALRRYAPQARMFSDVLGEFKAQGFADPKLREGGLDPKLLQERFDLGWSSGLTNFGGDGVEWNAPDPVEFATFDQREPVSLRRTLQNLKPNWIDYPQGMNCNKSFRSHPYQLEGPALALAEGHLDVCNYGGQWCLPPADEGLRRFVQAWRAIPPLSYNRFRGGEGGEHGPAACWLAVDRKGMTLYLVNRTALPRPIEVTFDAAPQSITDLVTGATLGQTLKIELPPFMPGVFRIKGVKTITGLHLPLHTSEVEQLKQFVDHLAAIQPAAQGLTQTIPGGGQMFSDLAVDGDFACGDAYFTFDQLYNPIADAWKNNRPHEVAWLMEVFRKDHLWWYEALGWPADFYVPQKDQTTGQYAAGAQLLERLKAKGEAKFAEVPGFKEPLLLVPAGEAVVSFNPEVGRYNLRMTGLFGGDYGCVRVEYGGKTVGRLGVAAGPVRALHQVLPVALPWPWSPQEIKLVSEGTRGLAISALAVTPELPQPIRQWSAIGLFDKQTSVDEPAGMAKVFPPEETIDLGAKYSGLGGKQVAWQKIDLGARKCVPLLDYFPYDAGQGNGVAYLATWINNPRADGPRAAVLYYAMDWYGKVWLNGKLVLPNVNGPWKHFAAHKVQLQPGWNCLLVKTATGRGGWKATFAFSDPGDLQYSPIPVEKTK